MSYQQIVSSFRYSLFISVLLSGLILIVACTSSAPESKPMPELTFEHIQSVPIKVAEVMVDNRYNPATDPHDVSSSFPAPPDIVLRRYAEHKFRPSGDDGKLQFVIEGANIHHSIVQPAGKFTGWLGLNRKDLYEVNMKIRMFVVDGEGKEGTHSILNMRRSIAIPERYSVADKEHEKFMFLEMLMDDVDKAVTKTLQDNMQISGYKLSIPTTALLASPEVR